MLRSSANLQNFTQPADGCYWQVLGVLRKTKAMHCKHTPSQRININKSDECLCITEKIIVRLFSKLYLPDIYRLDIPTTLLKPRDENDSVEFYLIITINSWFSRDVFGAILDDKQRFLTFFFHTTWPPSLSIFLSGLVTNDY